MGFLSCAPNYDFEIGQSRCWINHSFSRPNLSSVTHTHIHVPKHARTHTQRGAWLLNAIAPSDALLALGRDLSEHLEAFSSSP